MTVKKTGVLLVNLGTPAALTWRAVARFLHDFLTDPAVIDLPWLARHLLVDGLIIPFRTANTLAAYRQIWKKEGSPLLLYSQALQQALQQQLGDAFLVSLAMRYGSPDLEQTLLRLREQDCQRIVVLPLFPQYAQSTSLSVLKRVTQLVSAWQHIPALSVVNYFYHQPFFIDAWVVLLQRQRLQYVDHLLFSYHGVPVQQLSQGYTACQRCALSEGACAPISKRNRYCYRAQCYAGSEAIATKLGLSEERYSVCFQSRFGRAAWSGPDLLDRLPVLFSQGVRKLAIASPSFVTDGLETLEELGVRAAATWQALGGESLALMPSLNAEAHWVQGLGNYIKAVVSG